MPGIRCWVNLDSLFDLPFNETFVTAEAGGEIRPSSTKTAAAACAGLTADCGSICLGSCCSSSSYSLAT